MEMDCAHGIESHFAWIASIASCIALSDPDLNHARKFLGDRGKQAYEIVFDAIGSPSYLENCKYELIPIAEPDVLSESTFYRDLFENEKKLRLQKEFRILQIWLHIKSLLNTLITAMS